MRIRAEVRRCSFIIIASGCFLLLAFVFPLPVYALGEIEAWGDNSSGQCTVLSPNANFIAVAGGEGHSLGLRADGSIAAWGSNLYGECDVPIPNTNFKAIAAGPLYSFGLKKDGSIAAWGWNDYGQCDVPWPNTGFKAVAAGDLFSLGLKEDGSIVAWGNNAFGQCEVPAPNSGFTAIAAGYYHSLGLKKNGSILAWGFGNYGQCDVPRFSRGFKAIAAGKFHSLGLKKNGKIVVWGLGQESDPPVPPPNSNFMAIAAGAFHSLGLKKDGSIVSWGWGWSEEEGLYNVPLPNKYFTAIAGGWEYSLGLKRFNAINIAKCRVRAGKIRGGDALLASGDIEFPEDIDFNNVKHIGVNIFSLTGGVSIYTETIDVNVVKGKLKYTHRIPRGDRGAITSFQINFKRNTFSIKTRKVDLTGLACPLRLELTLNSPVTGDRKLSGVTDESIVNGHKTIPIRLMRQYENTLIVTITRLRKKTSPFSSSLFVKGEIAVENINDSNVATQDVDIVWGDQLFTISAGSFKAAKSRNSYKCNNIITMNNYGLVTANIDFDKCRFKMQVTKATIEACSGTVPFDMGFADFYETFDVTMDEP